MITVTVNGAVREHPAGTTVEQIAHAEGVPVSGSAVAFNGEVLPRGDWSRRWVEAGDRIEIVTAVQGG